MYNEQLYYIILLGNTLTVEYLPTSFKGRRLDIYEKKRFINLISYINYHFINSLFNDSMYKKIVLNLTKD